MHEVLRDVNWYKALPLRERAGYGGVPAGGGAAAVRRLERWRSRRPLSDDAWFAQRLAEQGLSAEELLALLEETAEGLASRVEGAPAWLETFNRAWGRSSAGGSDITALVEPLIMDGCERLRTGVAALSAPVDAATIVDLCAGNLRSRLTPMLTRVVALELNVARLRGALEGETPEARFRRFLRQRSLALLREYPVLVRQVVLAIDDWVATMLETLQRLCQDWPTLRERFFPESDPGKLTSFRDGLGDHHRGGRSVTLLGFASGVQVVYKPKPMAVECHFQQLLAWLNGRGITHPHRQLQISDQGQYGWCEFLAYRECASVAEVERFYHRQGSLLALLYLVQATDCHFENIIAHGEQPMLIDVETLFHPQFGEQAETILSTGMLPSRAWADDESAGMDASGLGWTDGQLSARAAPLWEGAGTDEMHLVRRRQPLAGGQNRPALHGQPVDVLDYVDSVAAGFAETYRLLIAHRDELLAGDGPLAVFVNDEVRVLLRPTAIYGLLLVKEGCHPDLLRDALERDRFFDRLWVQVEQAPHLRRVLEAERTDLWQNDIPVFTTRPGSCDLWTSRGERLSGFFSRSGMAGSRERVMQLSEADLRLQLWFIRASFATMLVGRSDSHMPRYALTAPAAPAGREDFLDAARAVGDRLAELALRGPAGISWTGLMAVNERYWTLEPLKLDLYGGLPGVAVFLATLGRVTGDRRYRQLAAAAVASMQKLMVARPDGAGLRSTGAFSGWGGLIYAFLHLQMPADAERVVGRVAELVEGEREVDLLSGLAGSLLSLLRLHRVRPSVDTFGTAVRCGERLLELAQPMPVGLGWVTSVSPKPLAGLSHGAAGIAWALFELAGATGDERFYHAACEAIAYERSLFLPVARNWADLRMEGAEPSCMTAWCHGAPGVGLGRLAIRQYLDTPETRAEIRASLEATLAGGFGRNHSLCHGDLGNIDLLLQAGMADEARRIGGMILASIRRDGWLCGVPRGVETPGLMNGLAGIGYGLLRLAQPSDVPSLLMLEVP